MNAASAAVLRAGFLLGDTSLVAYFDGDVDRGNPDSWAQWWATVTDVESGQEQRSVVLGQSDLAECRSPRRFCRSFGAADGWVLDPARTYTVVITVVQPDGSEVVSPPSNEAAPRATVAPPAMPAAQAAGCGCPTVLGPTLTGQAVRGAGVNTGTGAFSRTEPDLVMPSAGIAFNAVRYYSSANPTAGMFGTGWSWSYDARIVAEEGDSVRVRAEDGSEAVYRRNSDGSFDRPAGIRAKLTAVSGGGWQLVPPDQRRLRFDAQGRLISITNARGLGLTLAYDSTGLLSTITDASGRVVRVEHRTDLRMIRKITLPDNRSVQFDYDSGRLGKVQDPRGFNTSYQYDSVGRLTSITDARGNTAIRNAYDAAGRVTTQTDPEGGQTTFQWVAGNEAGATLLATTTDPDLVAMVDGYRDNVLLFSRNANQDVVVHRYDGKLRRNLVVDPNGNQEETRHDDDGNPVARRAPDPFSFTTASTFDDRSNLTAHQDGRGNTWVYEFNEFNEMTAQRNPKQERGYAYTYDSRGQQISRTDPRGKVTRYEYDTHGNRTAEISPTGRRTEMTYDLTGRMTSLVDPRGTVAGGNRDAYRTRFVYDDQSRLREVWQPGKPQPSSTTYDELGNRSVVTDQLSNSARMFYDRNSRLIEVQDPIGNVTAQTWTPGGRRASVTDGEGNRTTWTYNSEGRVATETSPRGNADPENADPDQAEAFTTRFHYDFNGNLIRADRPYGTDGQRVQIDTGFDALDRPTEQRDQFNVPTTVAYDNNGNVTEMTDERGEKLTHSFDEANRRDGSSGAAGAAQIEYDEAGNPVRQVTPTGGVVTWRYDDDGRPVAITEPRGNVAGADPDQYTTRYAYDQAGNLESVTDALGNATRTGYDALNRVVSQTDANNKTTRYGYDAADRLATVTGPDAQPHQSTGYTYNANSQVIKRTDPLGRVASMEYDRAGRMTVSTDPLGRRRDLVYDPDSNLIEQITARQVEPGDPRPDPNRPARTIFYGYDNLNRLTSKQLGADGDRYTYAYDAKNRPVEAADPAGLQTWEYDQTDRLIEAGRGDDVFTYTYDGDDRVKTRTYPDGTVITADYDAGDRVRELLVAKSGTSARYGFDYDVSDNLTKVTYPESTGVVQDRGYDRVGRLTSVDNHRGDQVLSAFELTPDPVGNPKQITTRRGEPGQPTITETTTYNYDAANRITSACYGAQTCDGPVAERLDYTYDLVGNRTTHKVTSPDENTTTSYTYDAADQLKREVTTGSRSTERTFDYDLEGNQTRAGTDAYTYALDHTMTSATIGGRTTDYTWDATGNRVAAVSGSGADARTQEWNWDLNARMPMLAAESETTAAGTTSRGYLYDPGGDPLALLAPSGAAYSYTQDWLGGVADVIAPNGSQEWVYEYDPFGVARGEDLTDGGRKLSDDAPANPMQYAGGYHDTSQGDRYQLRARNYDPGTGRFDATDPAPTSQQSPAISSYAYANNQPTVHTDPTGLRVDDGGGGGGGIPTTGTPAEPTTPGGTEQCEANSSDPNCVDNPAYLGAKNLVTEAEGFIAQIADEIINLILDLVGFNDAKKCVTEGDIVACVSTALQAVPWGKMFKAAKVMIKAVGVGRRLVESYGKLRAARAALAKIPQKVRKAGATADEAAEANKYTKQVANNAGGAKTAGAQAKNTTRKQADGLKQQKAKQRQENSGGESCSIAKGRGVNSFAPGTPVRMADGSSKPIEQIQPGDTVLATNPDTGETRPEQVTAAVEGTGTKHLIDLTLLGAGAGGGGPPTTVTATDGHRFYSPSRGWTEAAHLKIGDELRDEAGKPVTVVKTTQHTRQATVHNLTVSNTHTYYVIAGNTPVLVHNCGTTDFFTVQGADDAARLRSGGHPFPTAPERAHFGPGVYAWGSEAEAVAYAANKPGAQVVRFSIDNNVLAGLRQAHLGTMSDDAATAFMEKNSLLWGGNAGHGLDYISRPTARGTEHFFSSGIFGSLRFG